jgi:hypothetical protein
VVPIYLEADVPESREVTVTLPPGLLPGRVQLQVMAIPEPPTSSLIRPSDPAIAAEFDSFLRLLPGLRATHGGHYVAVRGHQVIASGMCLDSVLRLAREAVGTAPYYCGCVEPIGGYMFRSGQVVVLNHEAMS